MSEKYDLRQKIRLAETCEYLAISHDCRAWNQGRTVAGTAKNSQDMARELIESYRELGDPLPQGLPSMDKAGVELTISVGT